MKFFQGDTQIRKVILENKFDLLLICSFMFLNLFPVNFKPYMLLCTIIFLILMSTSKKLFFSLFVLFFLTSHSLTPGKYYSFVLFDIVQIRAEPFHSLGIIDRYGLFAADIMAICLICYF